MTPNTQNSAFSRGNSHHTSSSAKNTPTKPLQISPPRTIPVQYEQNGPIAPNFHIFGSPNPQNTAQKAIHNSDDNDDEQLRDYDHRYSNRSPSREPRNGIDSQQNIPLVRYLNIIDPQNPQNTAQKAIQSSDDNDDDQLYNLDNSNSSRSTGNKAINPNDNDDSYYLSDDTFSPGPTENYWELYKNKPNNRTYLSSRNRSMAASPAQSRESSENRTCATPVSKNKQQDKKPPSSRNCSKAASPAQDREPPENRTCATPLPIANKDQRGHIERWYRYPANDIPGIIIDSHQAKHVATNLFGPYQGSKGDSFSKALSSEDAIKNILDYLLNQDECQFLNQVPSSEGITYPTGIQVFFQKKIFESQQIRISSICYNPLNFSWHFHFFPVLD